jgi:hypothetical protein
VDRKINNYEWFLSDLGTDWEDQFRGKNNTIFHIKKNVSHRAGESSWISTQFDDSEVFMSFSIGLKNSGGCPPESISFSRRKGLRHRKQVCKRQDGAEIQ